MADPLSSLACPSCRTGLDEIVCPTCGMALVWRDGWYLDAIGDAPIGPEVTARVEPYGKPLAARLYDVDVRLTSRLLWGASVARQATFAASSVEAALAAERPLLDVPGGSGLVLERALHGRARPPLVIADLSVPMLARTRARLGEGPLYVRADVTRLPFLNATFGAVHSGNGFHLFPDVEVAAKELSRVLVPSGDARITSWVIAGRPLVERWIRYLARRGVCNEPHPVEDLAAVFEQAGLLGAEHQVSGSLLLWHGRRTS